MASTTADMPSREEMQAEINSSKPIPPPNLSAQNAEEVWTLESLVALQTLRSVQVKEWIETIQNGDEITCKSRFVASRIEKLVAANDVKRLRGLRYLLLLIEWYHSLKKGARGVLRVPRKEDLLQGWPSELVDGVARRFAEGGELNTWHKHNLLTHILALALVLDGCFTDTRDVRDDLRLDNKEYIPPPFPYFPTLLPPHSLPTPPIPLPPTRATNTSSPQDLHPPLRTRLSPIRTHRPRAQAPEDVEDGGGAERASLCEAKAAACISEDEGRGEERGEEVRRRVVEVRKWREDGGGCEMGGRGGG